MRVIPVNSAVSSLRTIALSGLALWLLALPSTTAHAAKIVLVAGGGTSSQDGVPATEFKLNGPFGVDFDKEGNFYIVEIAGHRVLKVNREGRISKIGGTGEKGNAGDNGPVITAQFNGMHALAVGGDGSIFVADTWNNRVRKIDLAKQTIAPVVGTGPKSDGPDGVALGTGLGGIYCVALNPQKTELIVTDLDNKRIRKVHLATGVLSTIAGNGKRGVPENGSEAKSSPLVDPRAAIADRDGTVYVLERGGNALRRVDPNGKIFTVVGTGEKGNTGDGGPALKAKMNGPKHLCFDLAGNVLIADTENHIIRRYDPKTEQIHRVAGSGMKGTAGLDGPPEMVQLNQPHGVFVHPDGTLYITDSSNNRVLKIVP